MKKTLLTGFLATLLSLCWAQERTVKGKITSAEDGSTLPGVNILLKGTNNGTVSDLNGSYTLTVPASGGTLVFTFIGLQSQEIEIGSRSVIDVQMSTDVHQLTEVLVTAQGIERSRNELAYSAQHIDGSAVSQTRDNNFVNGLSGKVAGLDIKKNNSMGGSTNVVIRGVKSISGNNQALFVVDGVPIDNSNSNDLPRGTDGLTDQTTGRGGYDFGNAAADINPDDIESINVLKGAAATALYGSRASNGVILITTKKGKGSKGVGVTLNTGVTVGKFDKSTFARYQKQYGQGYGEYFLEDFDIDGDGVPDLTSPLGDDASFGTKYDPNLLIYQWDAFDPLSPNYHKATPWVAAKNDPTKFFETAVTTTYSMLVDGQNDKGYYKMGYNASDEKGILPNSNLHKDFFNLGASYKMSPKFTASAAMNFSQIQGKGRYGTGYDDKNLMTNFRQWWNVGVDMKAQKEAYKRNRAAGGTGNVTWNWADPENISPIYWDNPYFTRFENYENDHRFRHFGYAMLNYEVTKWLTLMGRVSVDAYSEMQEERQAFGSVSTSSYSRYNREFQEYNYDFMATVNKELTEDFSLKAVVGGNIRKTHSEGIYLITNGGLAQPRLYTIGNSVNPLNPPLETYQNLQVDGVYVNATLGYKKYLFLDLAGRRDESSSLPKGENVYYYPSTSLSFVFSELTGSSLPWLSSGKVRANYAEVGNTAIPQIVTDTYQNLPPFGSQPLFSIDDTKKNPNLKAERTKSFEIGAEVAFLNDRVGFDFTYYKQNSLDQIIPAPPSSATGYRYKYVNAGEIQNKGIELSIFATPLKIQEFAWNVTVNWTRNRNEVISLPPGTDNLQIGSFQNNVSINATPGLPYGSIRSSDFVYDDKGRRLVDEDGFYQTSSQSIKSNNVIGNINPDWIGGINNRFTYKNLALSFLIDIKKGGDVYSLDMSYGLSTGLYPETAGKNHLGNPSRNPLGEGGGYILPGYKDDGTRNDIVIANEVGAQGTDIMPNKGFIYDAGYVKLREVVFTYSLPSNIVSKLAPFRGIDISIVGRNLWIIDKSTPYADPEEGLGSGNLASGYQGGAYPNVKNIGFNARFRF